MIELIIFIGLILVISWYGVKVSIGGASFEIFPIKRFFTKLNVIKIQKKVNKQAISDVQMGDFGRWLEKNYVGEFNIYNTTITPPKKLEISDLIEIYKKEVLNYNDTCPFCNSKHLHSFVLKHTKCKSCDQMWTD